MAESAAWVYRVQDDELSTLLRASTNFASKGFDPALTRARRRAEEKRAEQRRLDDELARMASGAARAGTGGAGGAVAAARQRAARSRVKTMPATPYESSWSTRTLSAGLPARGRRAGAPVAVKPVLAVAAGGPRRTRTDQLGVVVDDGGVAAPLASRGRSRSASPPHHQLARPLGDGAYGMYSQLVELGYAAVTAARPPPPPPPPPPPRDPETESVRSAAGSFGARTALAPRPYAGPRAVDLLQRFSLFRSAPTPTPRGGAGDDGDGGGDAPGPRPAPWDAARGTTDGDGADGGAARGADAGDGSGGGGGAWDAPTAGGGALSPPRADFARGTLTRALRDTMAGSTAHAGGGQGPTPPAGGGGLVCGRLVVSRDFMVPATLVAAKWGRVLRTAYGASAHDSVEMTVELPPLYYESLMADLAEVTGRDFAFTPQVQPAVFLVDIGAANKKAHRVPLDGDDPVAAAREDAADDAAERDVLASRGGGGGGGAGAAGGLASRGFVATTTGGGGGAAGGAALSFAALQRHELREAVRHARRRGEEYLLGVARVGDEAALERVLTHGFDVEYTPHPWYRNIAAEGTGTAARRTRAGSAGRRRRPTSAGSASGGAGTASGGRRSPSSRGFAASPPRGGTAAGGGLTKQLIPVLPDVNCADAAGNTPLMLASKNGWLPCVELLLAHGADHRRRNGAGQGAYDLARLESELASTALANGLPGAPARKRRAALTAARLDDRSVLECAAKGDLRRLRHLVEDEGHPASGANGYGQTALHFAVLRRDVDMVRYLAAVGADAHARNNVGQTPASLVMDVVGEGNGAQDALLDALNEGPATVARRDAAVAARAALDDAAAAEHAALSRKLREVTRGTTAAKAVALATAPGGPRDFAPPKGGRRASAAGASSGTPPPAAPPRAPASTTPTSPPARPARMSAAQLDEVRRTNALLAESWHRHALAYVGLQAKAAGVRDARARRVDDRRASVVAAERRRHEAAGAPYTDADGWRAVRRLPPGDAVAGVPVRGDAGDDGGDGGGGGSGAEAPDPALRASAVMALWGTPAVRGARARPLPEPEFDMARGLADPGALAAAVTTTAPFPAVTDAKMEHYLRNRFGAGTLRAAAS